MSPSNIEQMPIEQAAPEAAAAPRQTGPRTPEGKSRCRLNAFRHGLTGQIFVFSPEEADSYRSHTAGIHKHYQPVGPIEASLVDQIATGIWRLQRAAALEEGIFSMESATQPDTLIGPAHAWLQQAKNLALLNTYEGRIRRALDKDKAELLLLQQTRKQEAARAMDQAVALYKYAESTGKPYEPDIFFTPIPAVRDSVFSEEYVGNEMIRREVFAAAATLASSPKKR